MNGYSSFICNNQKLETTQRAFNGWMDKEIVIPSYNGIPLGNNKKTNYWYTQQLL